MLANGVTETKQETPSRTYQDDKVSTPNVEPRQVVYGSFRIVNVFVDYKRRSPRILVSIPKTNLIYCAILSKYRVKLFRGDFEREVPNVQYPIDLWREPRLTGQG